MKKSHVFVSLTLAALIVLASFLIFAPNVEKYTPDVTVKVIKIEMLEKVKIDGKLTQGAFTVALNNPLNALLQQVEF